MTEKRASDPDQSTESPDLTTRTNTDDPADLTGLAADERVDRQEDEVDRLATEADEPS